MAQPVVIKLKTPVQFGKDAEPVGELVLKPTAKHFRDFTLHMTSDGTVLYQPYPLALVGLRMAGHPSAFLDLMDPVDMSEVARVVMGFIEPSQAIGPAP